MNKREHFTHKVYSIWYKGWKKKRKLTVSISDNNSVSSSTLLRTFSFMIVSLDSHEDFQYYEHEQLQMGRILMTAFGNLSQALTITFLYLSLFFSCKT